jgi:zinc/manganese transport system substrate-binding protein
VRSRPFAVALGTAVAMTALLAGCASLAPSGATATSGGTDSSAVGAGAACTTTTPIDVVAGENVWGSIAAQLGGGAARVTSLVDNPAADPHDYEPTPDDGRTVARSRYVIANGLGYDPWLTRLADANPDPDRKVLDVGQLVGLHDGDNPHRWYFPDDVERVVDRITADYRALAPDAAACFDQRKSEYQNQSLAHLHDLLGQLHRTGATIGGSESLVEGLAQGAGLHLLTPPSYLEAVSEGNEPSAADRSTVDAQIDQHEIAAFVYNRQNATPDVRAVIDRATATGIPVVSVTETLAPANTTYQDWQADQLQHLLDALTGRGGS